MQIYVCARVIRMTQPRPIRYADTLADCTDGGTRVQKVVSPLHRMRQLRVCTKSPHPHVITERECVYECVYMRYGQNLLIVYICTIINRQFAKLHAISQRCKLQICALENQANIRKCVRNRLFKYNTIYFLINISVFNLHDLQIK